jgi:hypothetical protein
MESGCKIVQRSEKTPRRWPQIRADPLFAQLQPVSCVMMITEQVGELPSGSSQKLVTVERRRTRSRFRRDRSM